MNDCRVALKYSSFFVNIVLYYLIKCSESHKQKNKNIYAIKTYIGCIVVFFLGFNI